VNQLSTFIRSCAASLSIGNADDLAHGEAAKWTASIKDAQSKKSSAADNEDVEMKDSNLAGEIKLNGRVIPLKSIKLREAFASMSTVSEEIDQLKGATSNEDKTKLVQL
jgi:hypothetical protein